MAKRFDRALSATTVKLVHARRDAGSSAEHAHDEAMIFVPLSGSLRFVIDGKPIVADTQHALAVRAHTPHRHEPGDTVEYFIAYVDDARLAAGKPRAFRFANTALVRELAAELLTEATATRDRDVIDAAVVLLCAQAVRKTSVRAAADAPLPDDARLAKAITLAREQFRDGVTSQQLAKAAGMSTRTFERALAKQCGTTPRKLVEDLRLGEARARLATGRESVTTVAFDLGYKSLSHFVRRYRRAFGSTPSGK